MNVDRDETYLDENEYEIKVRKAYVEIWRYGFRIAKVPIKWGPNGAVCRYGFPSKEEAIEMANVIVNALKTQDFQVPPAAPDATEERRS